MMHYKPDAADELCGPDVYRRSVMNCCFSYLDSKGKVCLRRNCRRNEGRHTQYTRRWQKLTPKRRQKVILATIIRRDCHTDTGDFTATAEVEKVLALSVSVSLTFVWPDGD
jgi:hypothetical protein